MPLFLCRWPNGDCSVVLASSEQDALIKLDEIANAEGCPLVRLDDFQVHFRLTDDGELTLEGFGEITENPPLSIMFFISLAPFSTEFLKRLSMRFNCSLGPVFVLKSRKCTKQCIRATLIAGYSHKVIHCIASNYFTFFSRKILTENGICII